MLESGRDVSALEAGDILPHVATKNLVERGRLFTGVVQSFDGSGRQAVGRVPVQKRPLEGLDEVPQKLVSVLLPAKDHVLAYAVEFRVDAVWYYHLVGERVLEGVLERTDGAESEVEHREVRTTRVK